MATPLNNLARLYQLDTKRTIQVREDIMERDKLPAPQPEEAPTPTESEVQSTPTALLNNTQGQKTSTQEGRA